MAGIIGSFPFTLVGLLTIALFFAIEGDLPVFDHEVLQSIARALILPLWLMRTLVVMLGGLAFGFDSGFPVWYDVLTVPVLLLPYFLADFVLHRWRSFKQPAYRRR